MDKKMCRKQLVIVRMLRRRRRHPMFNHIMGYKTEPRNVAAVRGRGDGTGRDLEPCIARQCAARDSKL
jgi:hypothetical protein